MSDDDGSDIFKASRQCIPNMGSRQKQLNTNNNKKDFEDSDDDCDIFKASRQLPTNINCYQAHLNNNNKLKGLNYSDEDSDSFKASLHNLKDLIASQKQTTADESPLTSEDEYDFLNLQKKTTKGTRKAPKKPKQPKKTIGKVLKKNLKPKESAETTQELTPDPDSLAPTSSRPVLSPISQMLQDWQQKEENERPVSRRTRSSIGKRIPVETNDSIVLSSPNPQPLVRKRGRKAANNVAEVNAPPNPQPPRRKRGSKSANTTQSAVGRATRQQVAEMAARAPVLDTIDLVSAVVPRVEGFINLNSDEEAEAEETRPTARHIEKAYDIDNPEVVVNLNWGGEIQIYNIRQHQKLKHLFNQIAERNEVPLSDISVNLDSHFIKGYETPNDIGLQIYHILSGRALKSNSILCDEKKPEQDHNSLMRKPKSFQLKIQGDKWKRPLIIPMKKSDCFKLLYIKCAEELECSVDELKLFFDGELLEPDDTPKNQDMEGNEMIDLKRS